jgi:thiol-disulfide isomerase/thioredoxin
MTGVTIGPFAFPAALLVAFGAILLGTAVGNRVAAAKGVRVEPSLWLVVATAVLAARAGFVADYWASYAEDPLSMLDIRDGGFTPVLGVAAALVAGAWLAWRNRSERKALLAGVLAGSVAWIAGTAIVAWSPAGQKLPEVTLAELDGRALPLGALAGKPLVINLWASWCPPCRREMPALAEAQRAATDVTFVFVNQGESPDVIRAYLAAEGLSLKNVLLDPTGQLAQVTGSPGLPTTLFFDAKGTLVDRRFGELSRATLAQRLEMLRPATPPGASGAAPVMKEKH